MSEKGLIQDFVEFIVSFSTDLLMPTMIAIFAFAIAMRILIYYTISRESWFAKEFEKRVHKFIDETHGVAVKSFFLTTKKILEKTYYEIFEIRAIMKRRKPDAIGPIMDRVFLIQHGSAFLVKDTLKQIKYLKPQKDHPKLLEIAKIVFQNNPCFSKVFGVFPTSIFNDILNILPGIFIVGGIFGTFLGIMNALPELGKMDLQDIEGTKLVMDEFLLRVSFSMSTSIVGIILSVTMSICNTLFSADKLFVSIVDRFENSLDVLWTRSEGNSITEVEVSEFDEHKDPMEALAEQAINNQIAKGGKNSAA
ncbi:MAG: hypothetical protein R3B45_14680 [Bdellovibrionota bacterium]